MPKSLHRNSSINRRRHAETRALHDKRAEARQRYYDLARPEHQQYPPMLQSPEPEMVRDGRILRLKMSAEVRRQSRNQKRLKNHIRSLAGNHF